MKLAARWSRLLLAALAACACSASLARAEEVVPYQGEQYRYPNMWLIPRAASSLIAAPANVLRWDAWDYTQFGVATAATIALMLPAEPSGDVRFHRYIEAHQSSFADGALVKVNTLSMTFGIFGYTAIIFGTAWATEHAPLLEYGDLMLESLAVTQVYHCVPKLLLGREGPHQGTHRGRIYGPTRIFFPGGTPSGHVASTFALLTVAGEYFDSWPLRILALTAGLYVSASFIYHGGHFISDVIWGAALGYYVAQWVTKHRSTRYRYDDAGDPYRIAIVPMRFDGDGYGAGVVGRF